MSSLRRKALLSVLAWGCHWVGHKPTGYSAGDNRIDFRDSHRRNGRHYSGRQRDHQECGNRHHPHHQDRRRRTLQASDLPVGQYEITVQQKGFATVKQVGIDLTVGAALVENLSLAVGATTEVVEVQAAAAQVQTASSEVGALVGEQQMVDLPLNGRNFQQLVLLAPGMQPITNAVGSNMTGRGQTFTVGGARPEGQAILLDGTDVQGFYQHGAGATMLGTSLGVESIAEFETMTNTYSAEFGGAGSVVNGVTKAGTNTLHGSAYEYLRNSAFDARNYFDLPNGPPGFKRNQFGGSLGGPIKKDSTFFFVNYEGYRQDLGKTVLSFVPDLNAHSGILPCSAVTHIPCQGSRRPSPYPRPRSNCWRTIRL